MKVKMIKKSLLRKVSEESMKANIRSLLITVMGSISGQKKYWCKLYDVCNVKMQGWVLKSMRSELRIKSLSEIIEKVHEDMNEAK